MAGLPRAGGGGGTGHLVGGEGDAISGHLENVLAWTLVRNLR